MQSLLPQPQIHVFTQSLKWSFICMCPYVLQQWITVEWEQVSLMKWCLLFRGPLIERFHYIFIWTSMSYKYRLQHKNTNLCQMHKSNRCLSCNRTNFPSCLTIELEKAWTHRQNIAKDRGPTYSVRPTLYCITIICKQLYCTILHTYT